MMNESHDARLEALEIKIAYQEQTISQLNEVILEQQRRLDQLESIYRVLRDKLRSLEEPGGDPDAQEPPPHY
jgi:SlyX protein